MQDLFKKFVKFGMVGASGVVVDFGITWILREIVGIHDYVANSLGFLCAVVSNYVLNRRWTFRSNDPAVAAQFIKFLLVALVGLILNNGIIYLLHGHAAMPFYTAKLMATGVVMLWNFAANNWFTFKSLP
jgi:putative flippase GtrA